jgi:hypothetical protein
MFPRWVDEGNWSSTSGSLFSHVDLEERDPAKHPLRTIRSLVNEVLYNTLARKDRQTRHLAAARWFETLLGAEARRRLDNVLAGAMLERHIDVDLSIAGMYPPLHVPLLAGLSQGPGFPNLSCLGLLSDRILRRYVPLAEQIPSLVSERSDRV